MGKITEKQLTLLHARDAALALVLTSMRRDTWASCYKNTSEEARHVLLFQRDLYGLNEDGDDDARNAKGLLIAAAVGWSVCDRNNTNDSSAREDANHAKPFERGIRLFENKF